MTKIDGWHDRTSWERCEEGPRLIGGRSYATLVEFKRPCSVCGKRFSIFVTRNIADKKADSNSFGLRNCDLHRRHRVGKSEKAVLRSKDRIMAEELDGLYAIERELRKEVLKLLAENAALKNNSQKMPWET